MCFFFFFQAEDGIRDWSVTGVQTCALPIYQVRRLRNHSSLALWCGNNENQWLVERAMWDLPSYHHTALCCTTACCRRSSVSSTATIWQLDDCWPVLSWSVIGYYGVPKASYYA